MQLNLGGMLYSGLESKKHEIQTNPTHTHLVGRITDLGKFDLKRPMNTPTAKRPKK